MSMFRLNELQFDYEPYPIGFGKNVVDAALYERMVAAWPDQKFFQYMPQLGHKYSLSERNHPDKYAQIVSNDPIWRAVWQEVKSSAFITQVLEGLRKQEIDLAIAPAAIRGTSGAAPGWTALWQRIIGRKLKSLTARFEFSMMPSNGGSIKPHTDSPQKIITLVYSILNPGDWNPTWGGGTDVLRIKDPRKSFNHVNRQAEFEETEVLKTFEFVPNQLVVFVKTFNSWHAVRPMTGDDPHAMRRTLTINIEMTNDN